MQKPNCEQPDCSRPIKCRGWCSMHYHRWQRHGDPTVVLAPKVTHTVASALEAAVDRIDDRGCWIARPPLVNKTTGYSVVLHEGKRTLGHRLSYMHHVGPIPAGLTIDHLCRTTQCINPEHLEVVTRAENNRRAKAAARQGAA